MAGVARSKGFACVRHKWHHSKRRLELPRKFPRFTRFKLYVSWSWKPFFWGFAESILDCRWFCISKLSFFVQSPSERWKKWIMWIEWVFLFLSLLFPFLIFFLIEFRKSQRRRLLTIFLPFDCSLNGALVVFKNYFKY